MIEDSKLLRIYRTMLKIRMFEERVTREFRKGDMPGFVHTYIGAEAVSTGICAHLDDDDYARCDSTDYQALAYMHYA